jgi:hypothetical protein
VELTLTVDPASGDSAPIADSASGDSAPIADRIFAQFVLTVEHHAAPHAFAGAPLLLICFPLILSLASSSPFLASVATEPIAAQAFL